MCVIAFESIHSRHNANNRRNVFDSSSCEIMLKRIPEVKGYRNLKRDTNVSSGMCYKQYDLNTFHGSYKEIAFYKNFFRSYSWSNYKPPDTPVRWKGFVFDRVPDYLVKRNIGIRPQDEGRFYTTTMYKVDKRKEIMCSVEFTYFLNADNTDSINRGNDQNRDITMYITIGVMPYIPAEEFKKHEKYKY